MNRRVGNVLVRGLLVVLLILAASGSAVTLGSASIHGDGTEIETGVGTDNSTSLSPSTGADTSSTTRLDHSSGSAGTAATDIRIDAYNASAAVDVHYDVDFLPSHEDVIEITISLSVPDREAASSAVFSGQGEIEVLEATGFEESIENGAYRLTWDQHRPDASVTYRLDTDSRSRICADQTATTDWAFVCLRPSIRTPTDVSVESTYDPAGVGDGLYTFLGEYDEYVEETHGQRIRLVVPDAAKMHDRPTDVLESLAYSSRTVRVGNRNPEVFALAVPDPVRGGGAALSTNEEFWVNGGSSLRWNAWGHEYVHTRQDRNSDSSARWLTEAEASYYQFLLSYKRGTIDDGYWWYPQSEFDWFQSYLSVDEQQQAGVVLADPHTWTTNSEYRKGALVIAALDEKLRAGSDGEVTYQDVMRELNDRGSVDHETFVDALETVVADGDADVNVDDFVDRYVTGDEIPPVPQDSSLYRQGDLPLDVVFDLAVDVDAESDQSTTETDDEGETESKQAPIVVANESVTLTATLVNEGTDSSVATTLGLETPEGWEVQRGSISVTSNGSTNGRLNDDGTASVAEFAPRETMTVTAAVVVPANATGSHEFRAVASDADEHVDRTAVPVTVVKPPVARLEAESMAVENESVRLDATASTASGAIVRYEWDLTGDGSFDRETTDAVLDRRFDAGERTVTVRVVDEYGLAGTATVPITVTDVPTIETEPTRIVGANETISLEADVRNEIGSYTVDWHLPDGTVLEGARVETVFEPGVYDLEVIVEDEFGARTSADVEVVSTDEPRLTVEAPRQVGTGESVPLVATAASEVGDVTIRWTLPDGSTREGEAIELELEPGTHRIDVAAEDEFGTSATETVTVTVDDGDMMPGFGGAGAAVGLLAAVFGMVTRRRLRS